MSTDRTLTLRVSADLLERIERAAAEHGETRTQYVLSWLPVYYDKATLSDARSADQDAETAAVGHR